MWIDMVYSPLRYISRQTGKWAAIVCRYHSTWSQ